MKGEGESTNALKCVKNAKNVMLAEFWGAMGLEEIRLHEYLTYYGKALLVQASIIL